MKMILYGVYAHILFFIFSWSVAGNSHSCHHCDNSPHSLHIDCMFPPKVHKLNSLSDTISNLAACFSTKPTACLTVYTNTAVRWQIYYIWCILIERNYGPFWWYKTSALDTTSIANVHVWNVSVKKHWQTISAVKIYCMVVPINFVHGSKGLFNCFYFLYTTLRLTNVELLYSWLEMSLCMCTSFTVSGKDQNATGHQMQTMVRRSSVNVWLNKMCCGINSIFIFVCIGSETRRLLSGDKNTVYNVK